MTMAVGFAVAEGPCVLFEDDFNGDGTSPLMKGLLAKEYVSVDKEGGPDGSPAIKVAYVGYELGSRRVVHRVDMGCLVEDATLSYDVKFDEDFQWTHGGKLHGVGPRVAVTGGNKRVPERWSSRVNFAAEGRLKTYLYDQNPDKKWGVGTTTEEPVLKRGVWHRVQLYTKLNTPGESNGEAAVWVDGREVVRTEGVMFRGVGGNKTLISSFMFSTFHGGNTDKWTPRDAAGKPTTVYAWFDNFKVTEGAPEKGVDDEKR
ncbi:MAG: hypothetical protein GX230_01300 [Lentisphaerae bacterium]|nr:hypothetical protein [Lentisphaerota bacterium]